MEKNNVISFKKIDKERKRADKPSPRQFAKKKKDLSYTSETIKLWRFSLDVDELIKFAIGESRLSTEEIAAVLAHRIGHLTGFAKDPQKLSEFCQTVIDRMTPRPKAGPSNKAG